MIRAISHFIRRERKQPEQPLYYTRLARKSDSDWKTALSGDPHKAVRWLYAAATAGQVEAQLAYGHCLLEGRGCPRNDAAAYRWFTIAATNRNPEAVNMLGRCHEHGWGVPSDCETAAALYREAAEQDDGWAMFNLACLLLDGRGVAQDRAAAFRFFDRAARLGHMKSLNMLGFCHEHGWGCAPDMIAATAWYRRAAEAGDFRGQYRMAQLFLDSGLRQEALPLLRRAIDGAPPALCGQMAEEMLATGDAGLIELGRFALARHDQATLRLVPQARQPYRDRRGDALLRARKAGRAPVYIIANNPPLSGSASELSAGTSPPLGTCFGEEQSDVA